MRIVYIAYGLLSPTKAHNLQTVQTADALAERGHEVTFVNPLLPADRRAGTELHLPRCRAVLVPAGGLFELHRTRTASGRFWSLFADRSLYALRAVRHARAARPDALVTRDLVVCYWLLAKRFLTRAPVAHELHSLEQVMFDAEEVAASPDPELTRRMRSLAATDFAGHQDDRSLLGTLYKRFLHRIENATLRRVPVVLPLTRVTARRLEHEHGVARSVAVPSGHSFDCPPPADKAALRRALGLPVGPKLAVYSGLSLSGKGIESIFEVARHLTSDCVLAVVGAGPDQRAGLAALRDERGLRSRILFLPRVEHRRVPDYLGAADLGLLLYPHTRSLAEFASPLKLVEYLACGLPVVATRLPGIEEIVQDGVNGRLVAPGDPREAAAVIDETLRSPSLLAALAAGARSTSLEYTYERRAERLEDALCIST